MLTQGNDDEHIGDQWLEDGLPSENWMYMVITSKAVVKQIDKAPNKVTEFVLKDSRSMLHGLPFRVATPEVL